MSNTEILEKGLMEVVSIKNGDLEAPRVTEITPHFVSVQDLRRKLHLSQDEFAQRYKLKVGTVRNWEQGIRSPDQSAQVLLRLIERQPDFIYKLLKEDMAAHK